MEKRRSRSGEQNTVQNRADQRKPAGAQDGEGQFVLCPSPEYRGGNIDLSHDLARYSRTSARRSSREGGGDLSCATFARFECCFHPRFNGRGVFSGEMQKADGGRHVGVKIADLTRREMTVSALRPGKLGPREVRGTFDVALNSGQNLRQVIHDERNALVRGHRVDV